MKKYLAVFCALMMLTAMPSCGDNQESISEPSSSVSESATEESTEPETTAEEPTTEKATEPTTKYTVPELDEIYEDKNIIFKYSSEWEKNEKDKVNFWEEKGKINFTINDNFVMKISAIDSEYSLNDEFIAAEEKRLKEYNRDYEIYQSKDGNKFIAYEEKATKSKKVLASAAEASLVITFYNYSSEYDEVISAIIETVQVKDDIYQANNPRVYSKNLDQTFENEDIIFKYSSEWDKTIKSDEKYGYLYAEFKIDPAYEFQMKISVEPIALEYSSNDEFIEDGHNEESEIFITDSGDKLIYYKFNDFDNTIEVRRLRAYNGKQIWIEFKDYSSGYDEIIKKIIDTVEIKENFEKSTEKPTETPTKTPTVANTANSQALKSAKGYIDMSGFSYESLIGQLEFEGFSYEEAVYAADNCGADWNEEALESAKGYIRMSGFSYSGLIKQLEFEKFTHEQAVYGADNCGADWNQQAADTAQSYMNFMSMSREELIDQLIFEGFTQEQAEYGASSVGY